MAEEFNLNEVAEETPKKKRGRKKVEKVVEEEPIVEETTVEETPIEEQPIEETPVEEVNEEPIKEDIIEPEIQEATEETASDTIEEEEVPEPEKEEEKPLIIIEEENKPITKNAGSFRVEREIVYTLPSVTSPKRTVAGKLTILDICGEFYKVLYIAPGRGTDIGYMPKSISERYIV